MGSCLSSKDESALLDEPLTQSDLDLIKQSWEAVPNPEDFGVKLMIKIFTSHEEIKYLWIFASNLETEQEMLNNSQLRHHAKKVVDSLTKIIIALVTHTTSNLEQDIQRIGRTHFHHDVKKEHFGGFEESLIFCLKENLSPKLFDNKTKIAWKKALKLVYTHFSDGLGKEEKEADEQEKLKLEMKEKLKQK